jgi:serine O-acetyltransferase
VLFRSIYSGASILGGETVIGDGVVVGCNAFITETVPCQTKVSVKSPELRFKNVSPDCPACPLKRVSGA